MPSACVCGQKVNRIDPDKIICVNCLQYFHCKCYEIGESEYEFLKNAFLCKKCHSERRSSMHEATITPKVSDVGKNNGAAALDVRDENCNEVISQKSNAENEDNNEMNEGNCNTEVSNHDLLVSVAGTENSTVNDVSISNPANNIVLNSDKGDNAKNLLLSKIVERKNACNLPKSTNANKYTTTIDMIYAEMIALKNSNIALTNLVSTLHSDNLKLHEDNVTLLERVNALEFAVRSIQTVTISVNNDNVLSKQTKMIPYKNNATNAYENSNAFCEKNVSLTTPPITATVMSTLLQANTHSKPVDNGNTNLSQCNKQIHCSTLPENVHANSSANTIVDRMSSAPPSFAEVAAHSRPVIGLANFSQPNNQLSNKFSHANQNVNSETNAWTLATQRKKKKTETLIGRERTDELNAFVKMRWLHVSSFSNNTTADNIINFITKRTNIDKKLLICLPLIKKDAVVTELKYINFKLGVSTNYYNNVFDQDLWPENVKVRPFNFLEKQKTPLQPSVQQSPSAQTV